MTTPFAILAALAGLSHREAAELLNVRPDTVKSWSAGRNRAPAGAVAELRNLIAKQERSAAEALTVAARLAGEHGAPDTLELGEPVDDEEARSMGWPCVGAWRAMAARVTAGATIDVAIVPRGSTAATRAAKAGRP